MAFTDSDRLRRMVGETIPMDGTSAETMFSEEQILDFLDQADNNLTRAAYIAWQVKAAEYANLVTVSEGNSQRNMSDLHKKAMEMVAFYRNELTDGAGLDPTLEGRKGRVNIGVIQRGY